MRLALLTFLLAVPATAQSPADTTEVGRIVGRVTDAVWDEPLIGASVQLVDTTMGSVTGAEGEFSIVGVPAGRYTVQVAYVGFDVATFTGIDLAPGETVRLDAVLSSQVLCECVITFAEPEAISRSVYQARVASYQHWASSCCTAWLERDAVPTQRWETR